MVEFNDGESGQRHRYAYDALGRRIARVVDADGIAGDPFETRYFYAGLQVVEEQGGIGDTLATYVYGTYIDEVLSMYRGGMDYYYHRDDLYNVMAVTDANGAVVERYEYADYGQPIDPSTLAPMVGDPSTVGNPYLFTGRRYDPETTWHYYRSRYLDPVAGRFTTRDTIGIWGDDGNVGNGYTYANLGNAYSYVGNRPTTLTDPMGREGMTPNFLCSGTHQCQSRKSIGHKCYVSGVFDDPTPAAFALKQDDCCPKTVECGVSIGFTFNGCIPF